MAGQINISGSTEAVQLHGNDDYTVARDFTFPDASGELLIKDANDNVPGVGAINGGPLAGFRNALIGNFYVWQRNISKPIPSAGESYLTADRWLMRGTSLTGGAVTSSRAYVEGNKYQALRLTVTSPTASHLSTYQKVEAVNCRHLAGKEVTFSVYATNFTPVLTVGYRDSSDAIQLLAGTTVSLGGDRFSTTVTLPDVQFGSDFDETGLEVFIQTPLNTAVANGQYNIWHPQLEPGPVATLFEMRPIGTELALCQRYYQIGRVAWNCVGGGAFTWTSLLPSVMRISSAIVQTSSTSGRNIQQSRLLQGFGRYPLTLQLTAAAGASDVECATDFSIDAEL